MGTMDSFVPTEGSKYSSSRKRKGNCTKNPRIFFSSSAAFTGSSFANLGLLMKSRSWVKLFTWSLGRHRKTWSKQKEVACQSGGNSAMQSSRERPKHPIQIPQAGSDLIYSLKNREGRRYVPVCDTAEQAEGKLKGFFWPLQKLIRNNK